MDKDNLTLLDPDDDGVLDLMEIFEDRFGELKEISLRIGEATEELGATINVRTTEINRLTAEVKGERVTKRRQTTDGKSRRGYESIRCENGSRVTSFWQRCF